MPNYREPPVNEMRESGWPSDLIDWLVQLSGTFSNALNAYLVFNNGNRAIVTAANKQLTEATTTSTEIGYVHGLTSGVQVQLNAKVPKVTIAALAPTATLTDVINKVNEIITALAP